MFTHQHMNFRYLSVPWVHFEEMLVLFQELTVFCILLIVPVSIVVPLSVQSFPHGLATIFFFIFFIFQRKLALALDRSI
jgi:hypothetical protein